VKQFLTGILALLALAPCATSAPEKISLPLAPDLTRADIYIVPAEGNPAGTLILCPGHNGNGEGMVNESEWNDFARRQNLNLVGLSFASNDNPQDSGYFKPETGAGGVLLTGLRQAFGSRLGPVFLYGFSRGAQFAYGFAHWKPDLVLAWCAYSATEWDNPAQESREPRGIIACGDQDEPNYSTAALQFLKGRSMGKPWTWVSLADTGHVRSVPLETFARAYFASILLHPSGAGIWLDVDTKAPLVAEQVQEHPTLASWLPDEKVAEVWKNIHQP
jgi:poly(3-hydroxybutyrate) depolymerase